MFHLSKEKILFFSYKFFCLFLILFISFENFYKGSAKEVGENSVRIIKLSDQLRCPTCMGLSVKDSDAGFSKIIKGKIVELIRDGKSDEEIIQYFVKRYGEWILRSPTKTGFNLILWMLPGIGILIGLFWVFLRFKILGNNIKETKLKELTPEEEKKVIEDLLIFKKD